MEFDLIPNYKLPSIKITETKFKVDSPSPEQLKKRAEFERNTILKREQNFNKGINFHENLQKIDIELIEDTPEGFNMFNSPSDIEICDLARSIENVGLIHPIIVTVDNKGVYNVICGRCRVLAYIKLFQSSGLSKYKFISSYVIKSEDVDELFLRTLVIESNISFRSISKFNMIQALIINYEIMKKSKLYRNEKNIGMELSKTFQISQSTLFNFLRVKNLCDPGLTLLYENKITLKSAIYLTKVPKEIQINILEKLGPKGVKAIFKLKLLTSESNISMKKLEEKIKLVENLTPLNTKIVLEVHKELVNPLIDHIISFKKKEAATFAGKDMRGNIKKAFKVKYNKDDMEFYIEKNIIDEKQLRKLEANTIGEMIK